MPHSRNDHSTQHHAIHRQLIEGGYIVLGAVGKDRPEKGWSDPRRVAKIMSLVDEWPQRFSHFQTTTVIVANGLCVLDFDVDDEALIGQMLDYVFEKYPDIYNNAPLRRGKGHKLALFMQLGADGGNAHDLHSHKFTAADGSTHGVEAFVGNITSRGNYSRYFGIYGAHSFNDDGSVKISYRWGAGKALHEVALKDLPVVTPEWLNNIVMRFEAIAAERGLTQLTAVRPGDEREVYDITDETVFECQDGELRPYSEMSEGMRCTSSFHDGTSHHRKDKCRAQWSHRHDCIGVVDFEGGTLHLPADKAPPDLEALAAIMRPLAEELGVELPGDTAKGAGPALDDFYAFLPTHQYLYRPTGALWPMATIDRVIGPVVVGTKPKKQTKKQIADKAPIEMIEDEIPAHLWLDRNAGVVAMTWAPGLPQLVRDRVPVDSGWQPKRGAATFNKYLPPPVLTGDPAKAGRWLDMLKRVYPDHADHMTAWMAHRIQRPAEKVNHALVMTGSPGIGKDTLLEPLKQGVGSWNFREVSPHDMVGANTDFMQSVVLRVSEARDLGEVSRFSFYEASKTIIAAPPDMARVNIKYVPQFYTPNVTGVVFTTNYPSDGLYLPRDDRRHYVCGTEFTRSDVWDAYCADMWAWYAAGGAGHVVAYLKGFDLSRFNAGAPPPKTAAFWHMVDAGRASEEGEIRDAITALGDPAIVTKADILTKAEFELRTWMMDKKNTKALSRRLDDCGYVPVRNPDDKSDGRWLVAKNRVALYGRKDLSRDDRYAAAEAYKAKADELYARGEAAINEMKPKNGNVTPKKR